MKFWSKFFKDQKEAHNNFFLEKLRIIYFFANVFLNIRLRVILRVTFNLIEKLRLLRT